MNEIRIIIDKKKQIWDGLGVMLIGIVFFWILFLGINPTMRDEKAMFITLVLVYLLFDLVLIIDGATHKMYIYRDDTIEYRTFGKKSEFHCTDIAKVERGFRIWRNKNNKHYEIVLRNLEGKKLASLTEEMSNLDRLEGWTKMKNIPFVDIGQIETWFW